jgi:MSHA biogenesis protein MshE
VCESCAEPVEPTAQEAEWIAAHPLPERPKAAFMRGRGCSHCNAAGFAGRTGVYELLEMTGDLVAAATRNDAGGFIRVARERMAGQTLTDHALRLAYEGRTTLGEVMRIAALIEE